MTKTPTTPTGSAAKKSQRQPQWSVIQPPRSGATEVTLEDSAHQALVLAALTGRDDVADDRLRERHQCAHAEALHRAARDEGPEVEGRARR